MGLDKIHEMLTLHKVASFAGLTTPTTAEKPKTEDKDKVETKSEASRILQVPETPASGI